MKKTILEHMQNLPEEYREEAVKLFKESRWFHLTQYETEELQSEALAAAFPWIDPKWIHLYDKLKEKGL